MISNTITEKTLIPLSLMITVAGGIFWLSTIYFQAAANARDISDIKSEQRSTQEFIRSVDARLSHIEGKLGVASK